MVFREHTGSVKVSFRVSQKEHWDRKSLTGKSCQYNKRKILLMYKVLGFFSSEAVFKMNQTSHQGLRALKFRDFEVSSMVRP